MKIYIIPKIIETHKGQFEFSFEKKLIEFVKFIKPYKKIEILYSIKKITKNSMIIISGGNNIQKFSNSKSDIIRSKLDNYYFNLSKENNFNIKILVFVMGHSFYLINLVRI